VVIYIDLNCSPLQRIYPQQVAIQTTFEVGPLRVIAQGAQDDGQPIIAEVQVAHRLARARAQRLDLLGRQG